MAKAYKVKPPAQLDAVEGINGADWPKRTKDVTDYPDATDEEFRNGITFIDQETGLPIKKQPDTPEVVDDPASGQPVVHDAYGQAGISWPPGVDPTDWRNQPDPDDPDGTMEQSVNNDDEPEGPTPGYVKLMTGRTAEELWTKEEMQAWKDQELRDAAEEADNPQSFKKAPTMKRISIGTWAYSIGPYGACPIPFPEVCSKLKGLGFDGLELGGFGVHPNPSTAAVVAGWSSDSESALKEIYAKIRNEWESRGMGCSGLAADLWSEKLITAPDDKSYVATFRKNLKFCNGLGIDVIRVDTTEDPGVLGKVGTEPKKPVVVDYKTALKRVCGTWKKCAKAAADAGIRVVWEFEPGFAFNKPSDIFRVLDGVNQNNFGVMFDTCHANMVAVQGARQPGKKETLKGGIRELAERLKGKIGRVHLIDSDGSLHDNHTSTHPPFGEGNLNFDEFMPAIVAAGCPDDWWTIDLCFWPDAWKATKKCKTAIDKLNKKYG